MNKDIELTTKDFSLTTVISIKEAELILEIINNSIDESKLTAEQWK